LEAEIRKLQFEAGMGSSMGPYLKNKLRQDKAERVAQVAQHLPSKHKSVSSNSSATKKKFSYLGSSKIEGKTQRVPIHALLRHLHRLPNISRQRGKFVAVDEAT
jgi:hypothetical protein